MAGFAMFRNPVAMEKAEGVILGKTRGREFSLETLKCDREFDLVALSHPEYSPGKYGPRVVLGYEPGEMHSDKDYWRVPIDQWPARDEDVVM